MTSHYIEQHFRLLHISLFSLGLALSIHYAENQILTVDPAQMLTKGYLAVYHNIWLPYGNIASATANVPGYLSTVVIGVPLLVWDNPWAPMLLLLALRIASFILFDAVIKQIFSANVRLLFIVLYWLNPWLLYESVLYNPSYLCFFAALHLWSAFKQKEKSSFIHSFLHVAAIGGAMQLHYSWPILALISGYLLVRKMVKPCWSAVSLASLVILLSLVPYYYEYAANAQIRGNSDRYLGYGLVNIYPVLQAVLYWLRYGAVSFAMPIITDTRFDWVTQADWFRKIIQYCWQGLLYAIGAISVVANAGINWQAWRIIKYKLMPSNRIETAQEWLLLFAFAAFGATIICAMLSPIAFKHWHLLLVFPTALFPALALAEQWRKKVPKGFNYFILSLAMCFTVTNLITAHYNYRFSYKVSFANQVNKFIVTENLAK